MHRLKPLLYALFAFLAAVSVSVGDGGVVLLRFPPLPTLFAHVDLYAAGFLAVLEVFSRLVPSSADSSVLTFLARLADSVLPDRAHGGGKFISHTFANGSAQ